MPSLTIMGVKVGSAGGGSGMKGVLQAGSPTSIKLEVQSAITAVRSHRLGVMNGFLQCPFEQAARQRKGQAPPGRSARPVNLDGEDRQLC